MDIVIIIIFCLGYLFITLEHAVEVSKPATVLITGVLCWMVYVMNEEAEIVTHQLLEQLGEVSSILFFLMVAMTIVELIDSHNGFDIINATIRTRSARKLPWIICVLTFFYQLYSTALQLPLLWLRWLANLSRMKKFQFVL